MHDDGRFSFACEEIAPNKPTKIRTGDIDRRCEICGQTYRAKKIKSVWCSAKCRNVSYAKKAVIATHSIEGGVQCQICGAKFRAKISGQHTAKHNLTYSQYVKQFPDARVTSEEYSKWLSNKISGANNPGYQHGGKFSPFSKKFIRGSEEQRRKSISKALANRTTTAELSYYTSRGMNIVEATRARKLRQQTFSLNKCVEKHGEEEGRRIWQKRQDKWQATLNAKTDEEKARINLLKGTGGAFVSKESLKWLIPVYKKLRKSGISRNDFLWGITGSRELVLRRTDDKTRNFKYDFTILPLKVIVEYHGRIWHPRPWHPAFADWKHPFVPAATAQAAYESDVMKRELAETNGYRYIEIFNDELPTHDELVIKCLKNQ